MKVKLLLHYTVLFLLFSSISHAQYREVSRQSVRNAMEFRLGYLATIRYPGLAVSLELPRIEKRYMSGDSLRLRKTKTQRLTVNYSFYHHRTFHTNHMVTAGYLWRRTNTRQWFIDFEPQLGISRTFVDGTTYKVSDAGVVSRKKMAGDWFVAGKLSFAVGRMLSSLRIPQTSIFLKPSLIVLFPYNNFLYARPAIEFGVRRSLFKSFTREYYSITKSK